MVGGVAAACHRSRQASLGSPVPWRVEGPGLGRGDGWRQGRGHWPSRIRTNKE